MECLPILFCEMKDEANVGAESYGHLNNARPPHGLSQPSDSNTPVFSTSDQAKWRPGLAQSTSSSDGLSVSSSTGLTRWRACPQPCYGAC